MRRQSWRQWRDLAVRLLARLSLVVVLAVLGALFVGSAATSQAASDRAESSALADGRVLDRGMPDQARPAGVLLGSAVIGGGLVVLMIGAFKPPTRTERRELAGPSRR